MRLLSVVILLLLLLVESPARCQPTSTSPQTTSADEAASQTPAPATAGTPSPAVLKAKGSIEGTVTDMATGKPIAEAVVTISREKPPKHDKYETEFDGKFRFENLEPGDWTVTVAAAGKYSHTEKIKITAAQPKSMAVALEDTESVDTLRISGKRTLIHPEKIGSTTTLDRNFLDQYKSGNDLKSVIESTPGVEVDSLGNIITRGEHNAVNYELDGAILPEASGVLSQAQFANPRSLQSIDVEIGGYQAHDGGGPLGAVVRMKSLPIQSKPVLRYGGQLGGPIQGALNYYASGALSQNKQSVWNKVRMESQGNAVPTCLGLQAPVKKFVRNGRLDLNFLSKVEFTPSERNRFTLTAGINETFLQLPTSGTSRAFGARYSEHDRQDFLIASYKRKGSRFIDEGNFHIINAFYSQSYRSADAFDVMPIINGEEPQINSVSPRAFRRNYVLSLQGNVKKRIRDHYFESGILSELRPVRTKFSAIYRNANLFTTAASQGEFQAAQQEAQTAATEEFLAGVNQEAFDEAIAGGASEEDAAAAAEAAVAAAGSAAAQAGRDAAMAVPNTVVPYGGVISPITLATTGPQFQGDIGNFRGFRYLQSAYLQDTWKPSRGFLKRLTLNAGVRADVYHGVFGNTMKVAQAIASIPGVEPFLLEPFQKQKVTNAQASGRFGGSFVITKNMALRASYSDIFQPPPVDVFSTPPLVADGAINGIFNGTVRPLQATRGRLVDASIETQVGPRFSTRSNLFYKQLKNFGDSGVIPNTYLYNRLTLSAQEVYGLETRADLRPARDGFGFWGFLSSSVAVAKLRGLKGVTGGIYEVEDEPIFTKNPDHDRRYALQSGLGYRFRNNAWCLLEMGVLTGVPDRRAFELFGPHPARTPVVPLLGLNMGYKTPDKLKEKRPWMPAGADVRIINMLNQKVPLNLGSPFQGTRYNLPIQVLAGLNWQV